MVILFPSSKESRELAERYAYKEWMVSRFINYIPRVEDFLESMEYFNHKYIRLNTLKQDKEYIKRRLEEKDIELKESIIDDVYEVKSSRFSLSSTPEYLLGYYYIQDLGSCLAVRSLTPKSDEVNLDMCAAPGGKTSYIAQLMNNKGLLIATESKKDRLPPLISNLERCGVTNTAVFHLNALNITKLGLMFDKIMLDAPCSCEGVIPNDKERKHSRDPRDIDFCSKLQKRLLEKAISVIKEGGVIVYTTCSFAPEENEMVIDYAIKKYNIKIEPLDHGTEALKRFGDIEFDDRVRNCRRFYPHIHNTLGFFIARIRV